MKADIEGEECFYTVSGATYNIRFIKEGKKLICTKLIGIIILSFLFFRFNGGIYHHAYDENISNRLIQVSCVFCGNVSEH